MNYSVKLRVHGNVQGVSFRSFAKANAEELGLKGYVKNLGDGTVEVFAEGSKQKIDVLIDTLRSGPRHGHVERVDVEWSPFKGIFRKFDVIY